MSSEEVMIMKKKKILFIANPKSGVDRNENVEELIALHLDRDQFDYIYSETKFAGHAIELARKGVRNNVDVIVACGGDGTVNEVAQSMVGSDVPLGIIPRGSGNGFAMHIGMGRDTKSAILKINKAKPKKIDTCTINERFFINLAGVGFDAMIAYKTHQSNERGFLMYAKIVLKEIVKFKQTKFSVTLDNEKVEGEFTTVVVANSSMYGYNFHISPLSELTDGFLDVVFIKKASLVRTFFSSWRFFNKTLHKSSLVDIKKSKEAIISVMEPYYFHIDGEGFMFENDLHFKMKPLSINVLFPEGSEHIV